MENKAANIVWHGNTVTAEDREKRNGHKGAVLWFTGLSGSGKSTVAVEVEKRLFARGTQVYILDGDNVRHGLNANLGFSEEDRKENVRRIGEVAKLFADAGFVVLTAFISPYRADRQRVRELVGAGRFVEVYVKADVDACRQRDPKGLYAKADKGEIADFTGVSAPYEAPDAPEVTVDTVALDPDGSARTVTAFLENNGYLS